MGIPLWHHGSKDRRYRTVAFDTPWHREEPSGRFAQRRRTLLRRQNAFRLQSGRPEISAAIRRERRLRQYMRGATQASQLVGRSEAEPNNEGELNLENMHPHNVGHSLSNNREESMPRGPRHSSTGSGHLREQQAMERMQRVLHALWRPSLDEIPYSTTSIVDRRNMMSDTPEGTGSPD